MRKAEGLRWNKLEGEDPFASKAATAPAGEKGRCVNGGGGIEGIRMFLTQLQHQQVRKGCGGGQRRELRRKKIHMPLKQLYHLQVRKGCVGGKGRN